MNRAGTDERYDVGEEIARGGMGRVLAATDRVLGRPVALKLTRGLAGLDERFAREMRITARLQHPAIVPIYDAGTLRTGEPFYAMRMIVGRPLDRAIDEATSLTDRVALLPAVISVAKAVAYAHGEGVLHRDLKPQNVIVGPFGETVVLDWGLAKDLRVDEPDTPTLAVGSGTQAGEVLGTPAYMAPEQLDGGDVDGRADVYGVGGILYQVLTGHAPHDGPVATGEVRAEAIVAVERRQPEVPAELAAIVTRALEADPARRYPTAAALANDLERFQAGALVQAHRYSLGERARKWIARHRGAVTVAAVALIAVVALSVVGIRRIVAERATAERERAQAQLERDRAAAGRDAAEKLVGFVLTDLHGRLEKVGRTDVLGGVGAELDAYYASQPPRDGADLVRRAAALGILADARLADGELDAALSVARRGVDAARASGDAEILCRAHLRLADVHRARGDLDDARAAYQACAELARARAGGRWPALLAASLTDLGGLARMRADYDEAIRLGEESLRVAAAATGDESGPLRLKVADDLALLALARGDVARAEALAVANVEAARADAADHADDPARRRTVGVTEAQAGRVFFRRGDLDRAERHFLAAGDVARALVDLDPANTEWLRDVAVVEDMLGAIDVQRGRHAQALVHLRASQDVTLRLHRMQPDSSRSVLDVVAGEVSLAEILRATGEHAEARDRVIAAIAVAEPVARARAGNAELEHAIAIASMHLGDVQAALGDHAAARAALEKSIAFLRALVAREDTPRARSELASGLLVLHDLPGDDAASRRHLDEAAALLEPLRPLAAADVFLRENLAEIDALRAKAKAKAKGKAKAK